MAARDESLASLAKGKLSLQDFEWEAHMRPSAPSSSLTSPPQVAIPDIDLHPLYKHRYSLNHDSPHDPATACDYAALVASVSQAASSIGFFQVYNHGISLSALESLHAYARRFFALPFEQKYAAAEFLRDPSASPGTSGYSSGSPLDSPNKWWAEAVRVASSNKEVILSLARCVCAEEEEQQAFSQILEECSNGFVKLAKDLTIVLLEGLALKGHEVVEKYINSGEISGLKISHYPPCPQPSMTLGLPPHSDVSILTILWQDLVGGLQVRVNKEWTTIKPRHDALVVNIGDIFQIWSNDQYLSGLHRVTVNPKESRFSMVYFYYSGLDSILTPIHELLQKTKQVSKFRSTLLSEHRSYVYSHVFQRGSEGVEYLKKL